MVHSESHGGFWALLDYEPVCDAARDDALFSSVPSVAIPSSPIPFPILPIETDPPQTKELRDATVRHFSPASVERLRPETVLLATELIDEFIERGECDIVTELATPLPARLMLRLLGFDESRYRLWVHGVHTVVHERSDEPEKAAAAGAEILAEIGRHIELFRAEGARGGVFRDILHATLDGKPLDDVQITMYGFIMMLGGMDTTAGLTAEALLAVSKDDELRHRLISDPALISNGTEEFLRLYTPFLSNARTVTRAAEFHEVNLDAGDRALLVWAAANRDPKVFPDPEKLDLERSNAKKHLAFGVGMHRCLGSHLARMMFQVMMTEVLRRIPDFTVNGPTERFADAGEVYALRRLPVRFTPAAR
jgi:cytochrome P450